MAVDQKRFRKTGTSERRRRRDGRRPKRFRKRPLWTFSVGEKGVPIHTGKDAPSFVATDHSGHSHICFRSTPVNAAEKREKICSFLQLSNEAVALAVRTCELVRDSKRYFRHVIETGLERIDLFGNVDRTVIDAIEKRLLEIIDRLVESLYGVAHDARCKG